MSAIAIRFTPAVYNKINKRAADLGVSFADEVRSLVSRGFDDLEREKRRKRDERHKNAQLVS